MSKCTCGPLQGCPECFVDPSDADQHIPGVGIKRGQAAYDAEDAAKREQQAGATALARLLAVADGLTIEVFGSLDPHVSLPYDPYAAMAITGAGAVAQHTDTRTDRRIAYDGLDQMRQESIQQAVAEVLVGMRHAPLEQRISAVIDAVLDA